MRRVTSSWRLIDDVLRENAASTFRALRPPASPRAIDRLERAVQAALPRDVTTSLRIHDGMRCTGPATFVNGWLLLPAGKIASTWRMQWDLQRECEFGGNICKCPRAIRNDSRWRSGWIPMLDFNGDSLILDLDPGPGGRVGQIFTWFNNGSSPMRVVADSFGDWLDQLATELTQRRFGLDEWGGIELRKRLL